MPAKIKSRLPECSKHEFILSRGYEPCLTIYTKEEYNKEYERFTTLSTYNPEQRRLLRTFFRVSLEVEMDNLGRFLIPKRLMQYAQLEREVLIVGAGGVLEIWNPVVYDKYIIDSPEEYSELVQKHLDVKHDESNGNGNVSPVGTA